MGKSAEPLFVPVLVIYLLVVAAVFISRITAPEPAQPQLIGLSSLQLTDMAGRTCAITDLMQNKSAVHMFVFDYFDSQRCIRSGLNILLKLRQQKHVCLAVAVHDRYLEVAGWGRFQKFSPFFMLKRDDFFARFRIPGLPILLCVTRGRVTDHQLILR